MTSPVVESATHLSVWIVGLVGFIYFVQQFESELKPLILAFIFVSILEYVVQQFEWTMMKLWCIMRLLVWKPWQIAGLIIALACKRTTLFHEYERDEFKKDILYNWQDLFDRWESRDAGRNAIFRILSVLLTLALVVLLSAISKGVVEEQVTTVMGKIDLYRHQVTAIIQLCTEQLPNLQNLAPEYAQNNTKAMIDKFQLEVNSTMQALPAMAESIGIGILNGILTFFGAHVMDLVFFLLYSAFMLFDPLHINLESEESGDDTPDSSEAHTEHRRKAAISNGWLKKVSKRVVQRTGRLVVASARRVCRAASGMARSASEPLLEEGNRLRWSAASAGRGSFDASLTGSRPVDEDQARSDDGEEFKLLELQHFVYRIVWQYFMCLVLLNTIFAVCVFFLLVSLNVDLSVVQAGLCFILAFIPELGALISMALPIPFVLLTPTEQCMGDGPGPVYDGLRMDCTDDFGQRGRKILGVFIGMILIKLLVANILNALIMGKNKVLSGAIGQEGEVSETHGVLVLFAVVWFSRVWGVVGMLISVPVISIVRLTINIGLERGRQQAKKNDTPVLDERPARTSESLGSHDREKFQISKNQTK